jgi:hypothetical protein
MLAVLKEMTKKYTWDEWRGLGEGGFSATIWYNGLRYIFDKYQ